MSFSLRISKLRDIPHVLPEPSLHETFVFKAMEIRGNFEVKISNSRYLYTEIAAVFVYFEIDEQIARIINGKRSGTLEIDSEPELDFTVNDDTVTLYRYKPGPSGLPQACPSLCSLSDLGPAVN